MKCIFCMLLAAVMLLGLLPAAAPTAEAASNMSLADLQAAYPQGKYWNHYVSHYTECADYQLANGLESFAGSLTDTICWGHVPNSYESYVGHYDCNVFDGGMQCVGFARLMGYKAFGTRVSTWGTTSIGNIKPGDVVFYRGAGADPNAGHTVFVIGVSGTTITVGECNWDARCKISWGRSFNLASATSYEIYSAPAALSVTPAYEVDTRYPTPFVSYTRLWWNTSDGRTPIYTSVNGSVYGYIYNGYNNEDDCCTILEVYTNGWCKVQVPGVAGAYYCQLSVFTEPASGYVPWYTTATAQIQGYRRANHDAPSGTIDSGDYVCVIAETEDMLQVIYPTSEGFYCRWFDRCALVHAYETSVTYPTCTEVGYTTYTCAYCGSSYQDGYTEPLGHDWVSTGKVDATCQTPSSENFVCTVCESVKTEVCETVLSDWSEYYPGEPEEGRVESAFQYRYSDYETTVSADPELEGWQQLGSRWIQNGSHTVEHVAAWPTGFSTTHNLYGAYNNAIAADSETQTEKVQVDSDRITSYIYWHWCRGDVTDGPYNRYVEEYYTTTFDTFHAFWSTTDPSTLNQIAGGGHQYSNASCCTDTYWWYCLPVYTQSYSTYEKEFTYARWGEWSDWSFEEYDETDTRQVQIRTVYRVVSAELADHTWDEGTVTTAATCTEDGVMTYTCSVCGETRTESIIAVGHDYENGACVRCGAEDPDAGPVTIATGWSGATQWTLTSDGTLTFSGEGNMKNYGYDRGQPWLNKGVDITSVVIEEGVTSVGSGAFMNLTTLESVTFPATTLTKMGEAAFYGSGLTAVEIPASLWTVQPYTFKNCTALTEVKFNEGNLQKISDGAFYGTGLTELVLPDCLDILDVYAFKGCDKLASITIGNGLTELREAVFYGTAIPTITIPEGITKIGPYAFKNCVKLETIDLPESLTSVGEASFYADTALRIVELPDAVSTIGNYAFRKCEALKTLTLSAELVTIGECSFYGCTSLTSIVIPDKVTTIKPYAFKTCTGLTSVTLGKKVATIGEGAFNTCTGLKTIVFPASLEAIGDYCFSGSYNLWKLTFQGDAPTIGTGAFKGMAATAYYPSGNATWTADIMQNYGGTVTWKAN